LTANLIGLPKNRWAEMKKWGLCRRRSLVPSSQNPIFLPHSRSPSPFPFTPATQARVPVHPLSPKTSILPPLVSEVPTPCRTILLLLHGNFPILLSSPPGGALPIVEYTRRLRPKRVTFLSLQHNERLGKSYVKYVKGHQKALLSKRDSS